MNLPKLDTLDSGDKKIFLSADLDVVYKRHEKVDVRLSALVPTIEQLLKGGVKRIVIFGHKGRPHGKQDTELSLEPLVDFFSETFSQPTTFVPYHELGKLFDGRIDHQMQPLVLVENLRFWEEEEANTDEFARGLSSVFDAYVNDAFGYSHREHTSIVGIPKYLPHFAGLHLDQEVEKLGALRDKAARPMIFIVSGLKDDKLDYLDDYIPLADKVLLGGLLPTYLDEGYSHEKVILGKLVQDKEDLTLNSIENFEKEIANAKTIFLGGPLGKYEDEGHRQGTKRVFSAVANSSAYKVAGGGDTEAALRMFHLLDKFDWVSTGGGAALQFLAKGTLPGLEALLL